jgi:triacylglycerol lipase
MVLDGYEQRQRERRGDEWRYEDGGERWGNDGLVTIESAKWGEFLGILEECDHWELRGARGFELDLWSAGGSNGDASSRAGNEGWSLGDWGRFVGAWKKEEKKAKDVGATLSDRKERHPEFEVAKGQALDETVREREKDHGVADEVVRASTEKLSAVFDWIVEQVPSRNSTTFTSTESGSQTTSSHIDEVADDMPGKKTQMRSELETKADLERFYVALCRKLYDEGL